MLESKSFFFSNLTHTWCVKKSSQLEIVWLMFKTTIKVNIVYKLQWSIYLVYTFEISVSLTLDVMNTTDKQVIWSKVPLQL